MIKLVNAQKEQKSEEDWFLDFNVPSTKRERELQNRIKRLKESDSKMHIYI